MSKILKTIWTVHFVEKGKGGSGGGGGGGGSPRMQTWPVSQMILLLLNRFQLYTNSCSSEKAFFFFLLC